MATEDWKFVRDETESRIIAEWRATDATDTDRREALFAELRALNRVIATITGISTGAQRK